MGNTTKNTKVSEFFTDEYRKAIESCHPEWTPLQVETYMRGVSEILENVTQADTGKTMRKNTRGIRGESYANAGRKRTQESRGYDLMGQECEYLLDIAEVSPFEAIGKAFYMGVEAGARMTEKKVKAWQKQ